MSVDSFSPGESFEPKQNRPCLSLVPSVETSFDNDPCISCENEACLYFPPKSSLWGRPYRNEELLLRNGPDDEPDLSV